MTKQATNAWNMNRGRCIMAGEKGTKQQNIKKFMVGHCLLKKETIKWWPKKTEARGEGAFLLKFFIIKKNMPLFLARIKCGVTEATGP